MAKLQTLQLKGNEYATVPTRLKAFREDNSRGSVLTKYEFGQDGSLIFTAKIVKDKSDPTSAEATGHSFGKTTGEKAFEKLETIAVGRALSLLGYLNNGQVASTEEMQDFEEYKESQRLEAITAAIEQLDAAKSLEELRQTFVTLGNVINEKDVIEAKDRRKAELSESTSTTAK